MSEGNVNKAYAAIRKYLTLPHTKLIVHCCSLCGYACGYILIDGEYFYDSGCDCLEKTALDKRSEDEVKQWILKNL
jgi:hypothetical protein